MKTLKKTTKRKINGIIFLLPWMIGFIMFFATPLITTIIYSFSQISIKPEGGISVDYIGVQNYIDLFMTELTTDSEQMIRLFLEENQTFLIELPTLVIFSLFLALIVNVKHKARGLVRVIFFLPIILGVEVVVEMMQISTSAMQEATTTQAFEGVSMSSRILQLSGLPRDAISFIQTAVSTIFYLITRAGVQTLIFLGGLQAITPSMYEVAKIEGATGYETFWKITIPATSNITFFVTIYTLVDLFLNSSITSEIYSFAFLQSKIGTGSALSVVFIINIIVLLLLVSWFLKKVVKLDYEKY